jgi:soluble lytic murein transglycosylase-like protein
MLLLIALLSTVDIVDNYISQATLLDSLAASQTVLVPYRHEIESAGMQYALPAPLIAAVIQEESRFEIFATRHEPRYMRNKYVRRAAVRFSQRLHGLPSAATELADRSRSIGLMQVMGETAREQGFDARYLAGLYLPANAIAQGAKLLRALIDRYHGDTLSAISAYNQGSARRNAGVFLNARYVYRVCVAWRAYQAIFRQ